MPAQSWALCRKTHWLYGPADLQIVPYDQEWIFLENKQTKPERSQCIFRRHYNMGLGAEGVV